MNPIDIILGIVLVGVVGILLSTVLSKRNPKQLVSDKDMKSFKEDKKLEQAVEDAGHDIEVIRLGAKPQDSPPAVPIPSNPNTIETQGEIKSLMEFPIGQKIGIELGRIVEENGGKISRVTMSRGSIQIKTGRFNNDPKALLFFATPKATFFVNPKKIIKVTTLSGRLRAGVTISYKLVYDILYGEALNKDGSLEWDEELEMILADSAMDQYVTIAAYEGGFQFTPTLKKVFLLLGGLGFFIGLVVNGSAHVIPTTIIHWIP